eukprot:Em0002g1654a
MNSTVADRNNGEECNEVRDDQGHSGEGDDNKLGLPCLSEQSKTISFNVLLLCTAHNNTTTKSSRMFTARKVPESVAALKLAIQELHIHPEQWRARSDHIASLVIVETSMGPNLPSRPPAFGEGSATFSKSSLQFSAALPLEIQTY